MIDLVENRGIGKLGGLGIGKNGNTTRLDCEEGGEQALNTAGGMESIAQDEEGAEECG